MKWFYNLKVGTKILSGFILVALIAGLTGYIGIKNIHSIGKLDKEMYELNTVPLGEIGDLASSLQRIRVNLRDIIIDKDSVSKNKYAAAITALSKQNDENLIKVEKTLQSEEGRRELDKLKTALDNFKPVSEKIVSLALAGKEDQALLLLRSEGPAALVKEIQESTDKLVALKISMAEQKFDENTAKANAAARTMLIVLCIGVALAIGLGIFITRIISMPVTDLARAASIASSGDLTVDITVNSKDEVGKLAEAFKIMISHMRELVQQIVEKSNLVNASSQQLNASAQQTAAGANETAATMGEITATVEQITSNTQEISRASETTAEHANEGNRGIVRVTEQMQNIENSSQGVSKSIDELSKKSQEINQIVELITSIADQTNLLALNAAIEAARAGEQGRGFAVVAEKVRKLAEQSANATKEISNLVNAIQLESQRAVESMAEGGKEVEAGTRVVQEVGGSFKEIINAVQGLTSQIQEVASATEQMSAGVQNVAASTEEQTAAMEEVAASAESLSL